MHVSSWTTGAGRSRSLGCRPPRRDGAPLARPESARSSGIALLVVMIVFVVLYLVVYQLHFSTLMEEKLASVRYGEVESDLAQHSVAQYVLTLLLEDLAKESGADGAAAGGVGAGAADAASGTSVVTGIDQMTTDPTDTSFVPIGTGGTAVLRWYDYVHENVFNDNRQQIGDSTVKIRIRDGERAFDLNQLFDYLRLPGEDLLEGLTGVSEEDLVSAVEGAESDEEAETLLRDKILGGSRSRSRRSASEDSAEDRDGGEEGGIPGADGFVAAPRDEYDPDPEFVRPEEERIQATIEMVRRAVLMLVSINEDNGYRYAERYFPDSIATGIVDYVLARRMEFVQNRIYLLSELLNVEGITPELFYGPIPVLVEDEEVMINDFVLERDEFGDIEPRYAYAFEDPYLEESHEQLDQLMEQFGRFASFPVELGEEFGLSRLQSNAMTRGMTEPTIEIDEDEREYILEPPYPLGLRDVFTTFSTGKINLNTASVPVLFGLLTSLTEDEAKIVAFDIQHYRNQFQDVIDEEGLDEVDGRSSRDLGQPTRQAPTEEELLAAGGLEGLGDLDASSLAGLAGVGGLEGGLGALSEMDLAALDSGYQDLETNYFTNLQQIELVDGSDGGPEDLLATDQGVDRVDSDGDTLLRRVMDDYQKSIVFGSTYFDIELKAKTGKSGRVKTGNLTVRRDPTKGMIEILMWKELEK